MGQDEQDEQDEQDLQSFWINTRKLTILQILQILSILSSWGGSFLGGDKNGQNEYNTHIQEPTPFDVGGAT